DLHAVAVDRWQDPEHTARDASIGDASVLPRHRQPRALDRDDRRSALRFGCDRRNPAVRRIHDERGLAQRSGADLADERSGAILRIGSRLVVALAPFRELLVSQQLPLAKLRWPLERHAPGIVTGPDALEIGTAPRRPRWRPNLALGGGVRGEDRDEHHR